MERASCRPADAKPEWRTRLRLHCRYYVKNPYAAIEDVDYRTSRRLDKALFQQLTRGKWIARKRNPIITGACGVGKSWPARALGQKACRDDFSVLYKRIPRMFAELETGRADSRYPRLFRALAKANLPILDDWGPDHLNADRRRDLMEIVEDRYNNAAIPITSQLPLEKRRAFLFLNSLVLNGNGL